MSYAIPRDSPICPLFRRVVTRYSTPRTLFFSAIISLLAFAGCGGGASAPQQPPPAPPEVNNVDVIPGAAQIFTGKSMLFTAQVTGTGAFDSSVNWAVNGVNGGNSTVGTIVGGQYEAPATPPNPSNVTITAASVQDSAVFGSSTVTVYAFPTLTSIMPNAASAGEQITLNGDNVGAATEVVFTGINGTTISVPPQEPALEANQVTVFVPFGTTSGPIYAVVSPFVGLSSTTNPLPLTRLPNLLVHAANKDLSSGESLQLDWRLLGANTPNVVEWSADSGSDNQ